MSEEIILTPAGKRFWGTKKKALRVIVTEKPVRTYGGYWSSGSISYWHLQHKHAASARTFLRVKSDPFSGETDPEYTPTADTAVVQGGVFNGKESSLSVYVTSKDGWVW